MSNEIGTQLIGTIERQDWLEPVEESVQNAVSKAFNQTGRGFADALNGVWLGHSLHPVVTDIPVGAWTTALMLDVLSIVRRKRSYRDAADAAIGLGLAGSSMAALTGLADWKDIKGKDRRAGIVHAALNATVATLYTASLLARRRRARGLGQALSMTGWAILLASTWIGGELVYKYGDAVDQSRTVEPPDDWAEVMAESDLPENEMRRVEYKGTKILLLRRVNRIYAIGETCSHRGGPLSEGKLEGDCVECPWHGSVFNLNDGSVVHGPATHGQPRYEVRVRDGQIEVKLAG